jgi:hypothetical protein
LREILDRRIRASIAGYIRLEDVMDQARREFRNDVRTAAVDEAMPVDAYLAEIDAFIDQHNRYVPMPETIGSVCAQGGHHGEHSAPLPPSHSAHDCDQRVADARHEPLA